MKYSQIDSFMRTTGLDKEPAFGILNIMTAPIPDKHVLGLYYPVGSLGDPDFGYLPPSTTIIPEDADYQTLLHELGHCYNWYYHNDLGEESAEAWRRDHAHLINQPVRAARRYDMVTATQQKKRSNVIIDGPNRVPMINMPHSNPLPPVRLNDRYHNVPLLPVRLNDRYHNAPIPPVRSTHYSSVTLASPTSAAPGDRVHVVASVGNAYTSAITFEVEFYVNSALVSRQYATINAGSSSTLVTDFTMPSANALVEVYIWYYGSDGIYYYDQSMSQTVYSGSSSGGLTGSIGNVYIKQGASYLSKVAPGGVFNLMVGFTVDSNVKSICATAVSDKDSNYAIVNSGSYITIENLIMSQVATQFIIQLWGSTKSLSTPPDSSYWTTQANQSDWVYLGRYTLNIGLDSFSIPSDYTNIINTVYTVTVSNKSAISTATMTAGNIGDAVSWFNKNILPQLFSQATNNSTQIGSIQVYTRPSTVYTGDTDFIIVTWMIPTVSVSRQAAAVINWLFIIITLVLIGVVVALGLYSYGYVIRQQVEKTQATTEELKTTVATTTTTTSPTTTTVPAGTSFTDQTGGTVIAGSANGGVITHANGTTTTVAANTAVTLAKGDTYTANSTTNATTPSTTTTTTQPTDATSALIAAQSQSSTDWTKVVKYAAIGIGVLGGALVVTSLVSAFKR